MMIVMPRFKGRKPIFPIWAALMVTRLHQQKHSVEQRLGYYGRVRQEGSSWDENNDQLSYDGDYRYKFNKHNTAMWAGV